MAITTDFQSVEGSSILPTRSKTKDSFMESFVLDMACRRIIELEDDFKIHPEL